MKFYLDTANLDEIRLAFRRFVNLVPGRGLLLLGGDSPEAAAMRDIAAIAREGGGAMIVDEIYHGLVYDGDYTTALEIGDDVYVGHQTILNGHLQGP